MNEQMNIMRLKAFELTRLLVHRILSVGTDRWSSLVQTWSALIGVGRWSTLVQTCDLCQNRQMVCAVIYIVCIDADRWSASLEKERLRGQKFDHFHICGHLHRHLSWWHVLTQGNHGSSTMLHHTQCISSAWPSHHSQRSKYPVSFNIQNYCNVRKWISQLKD